MNYRFSSWNTIYRGLARCFDGRRYHLGCRSRADFEPGRTRASPSHLKERRDDGRSTCWSARTESRPAPARSSFPMRQGPVRRLRRVAGDGPGVRARLPLRRSRRSATPSPTACCRPGTSSSIPSRTSTAPSSPGGGSRTWSGYHNYEGGGCARRPDDRPLTGNAIRCPFRRERARDEHVATIRRRTPDAHMAPPIAELLHRCPEPFVQVNLRHRRPERMAFGRVALIGDAAFAVRPHAGGRHRQGVRRCLDPARCAARCTNGDPVAALARWEPGQLALGRQLLARTREMGDRSQFQLQLGPGRAGAPPRPVRAGSVVEGDGIDEHGTHANAGRSRPAPVNDATCAGNARRVPCKRE